MSKGDGSIMMRKLKDLFDLKWTWHRVYHAKLNCGHTAQISVKPYSGEWQCNCGEKNPTYIRDLDWDVDVDNSS